MPAYFYLSQNTNSDEPEALKATEGYVPVKATTDGSQRVCITTAPCHIQSVTALTFDAAQALIDDWIAEENANPPLDQDGQPILQRPISLAAHLNEVANG